MNLHLNRHVLLPQGKLLYIELLPWQHWCLNFAHLAVHDQFVKVGFGYVLLVVCVDEVNEAVSVGLVGADVDGEERLDDAEVVSRVNSDVEALSLKAD